LKRHLVKLNFEASSRFVFGSTKRYNMEIIKFLTTFGCPLNPTPNILVKKKRLLCMLIALIGYFNFLRKGL
jgi:hypothetical protein